jgi:hypothetical protein
MFLTSIPPDIHPRLEVTPQIFYAFQGFPQRLSVHEGTDRCQHRALSRYEIATGVQQLEDEAHRNLRRGILCSWQRGSGQVVVWGDSFVEQLYPLFKNFTDNGKLRNVLFMTSAGCPPSEQLNRIDRRYHCDEITRLVINAYSKVMWSQC